MLIREPKDERKSLCMLFFHCSWEGISGWCAILYRARPTLDFCEIFLSSELEALPLPYHYGPGAVAVVHHSPDTRAFMDLASSIIMPCRTVQRDSFMASLTAYCASRLVPFCFTCVCVCLLVLSITLPRSWRRLAKGFPYAQAVSCQRLKLLLINGLRCRPL